MPETSYRRCISGIQTLQNFFKQDEAALIAKSSKDELAKARLSLLSLEGWESQIFHTNPKDLKSVAKAYESRDEAMANALEMIRSMRFPGARTAIWAHNGHIGKGKVKYWMGIRDIKIMGTHLFEKLGEKYVPIGLTGYKVEVNWGSTPNPPIPTSESSVEVLLHRLGHPYSLVDLRGDFLKPKTYYEVQNGSSSLRVIPSDHFRALLYLQYSAPMTYVER